MRFLQLFITFITIGTLDAGDFILSSPEITSHLTKQQEFLGGGCDGKNISPQLQWVNPPKGTKSFALTLYDPDATHGWWHWIVVNIPATLTSLPRDFGNSTKKQPIHALQAINDFGTRGFGGACPPKGDKPHRYVWSVYALNVEHLEGENTLSPAALDKAIHAHTLAHASLITYYGR